LCGDERRSRGGVACSRPQPVRYEIEIEIPSAHLTQELIVLQERAEAGLSQ